MRILSTDPEQPGIFAIGQEARGIFALGQMATGFVAVGQLARGVFALGQGAVGIFAVGQGAIAVAWGGGMIGIVGRGFGIVLKVLPRYRPERGRPPLPEGWIHGRVKDHVLVDERGNPLPVELTPEVGKMLANAKNLPALVRVVTEEQSLRDAGYREAPEIQRVLRATAITPWAPWPWPFEGLVDHQPAPLWQLVVRGLGVVALVGLWWFLVGQSLLAMFE